MKDSSGRGVAVFICLLKGTRKDREKRAALTLLSAVYQGPQWEEEVAYSFSTLYTFFKESFWAVCMHPGITEMPAPCVHVRCHPPQKYAYVLGLRGGGEIHTDTHTHTYILYMWNSFYIRYDIL